jgi:hypothetical protein
MRRPGTSKTLPVTFNTSTSLFDFDSSSTNNITTNGFSYGAIGASVAAVLESEISVEDVDDAAGFTTQKK